MKREIYISVLLASALSISAFMTGCGSSDSTVNKDKVDVNPQDKIVVNPDSPHADEIVRDNDKIEFKTSEDLDYSNAIIVDNLEGLKIAKTKDYIYLTFTHNSTDHQNIQFFIDTDSNSETGHKSEGGSEYKIENGQLHSFAVDENGTDIWHAYIEKDNNDSVKVNTILNKSDSVRIDINLFENYEFSVKAEALDADWNAKIISPLSSSKTFFGGDTIADANLTNILNYAEDINNSLELKIKDDENYLNVYLLGNNFRDQTQFYIDSDNNNATGKQNSVWSGFGADYMIENGKIYKYDSNQTNWDWTNSKDVVYSRWKEDKNIISLKIDRDHLNIEGNRLKFAIEMNDVKDGVYSNTVNLPKSEDIPLEYILNN